MKHQEGQYKYFLENVMTVTENHDVPGSEK